MDEWRAAMAVQLEAWDRILFESEELIERDDRVLAVVRALTRGRATGIETERVIYHLVAFRDDRVVRWRTFFDRDEALAELERAGVDPGRARS